MARQQQVKGKEENVVEVIPNAARTFHALRESGYTSFAAVMDLIDNSIDAGATEVRVKIAEAGKDRVIDILDDGRGMSEQVLAEALRLGSDVEYNAKTRLGKFGMGLVTASISLARNIWIITRQKGKAGYEATFDLGHIERENRFVIRLKAAESKRVIDTVGDQGTLVRLSMIDRISDTNTGRFAADLRRELGRVYRHFLKKGLKVIVNRESVQRDDPLMLEHPQTEIVLDEQFDLGDGTKARLIAVELPDLGTEGDTKAGIFPHNSGFYVVRNGREIIAHNTFGFYRHHHSYSHFRAELQYTGNSTVFHEDFKKASIHPDDRLLKKLRTLTEPLIAASGRRSRDRGNVEPVKLAHRTSSEIINSRMPMLVKGVTPAILKAAKEAAASAHELTPTLLPPEPDKPKGKRGRPTKEEAEKKKLEEQKRAEEEANKPTPPHVVYTEADLGDDGRFFQHELRDDKALVIKYNSRHPFIRMVAEAKQPKVSNVVDMITFALAKAEMDQPEGKKLVSRACDYLVVLSAPQEAVNGRRE